MPLSIAPMRALSHTFQSWLRNLDINQIVASKGYVDMPLYGRVLLAVLVPWLQFFTLGRPVSGVVCMILQGSLIGWFPAVLWSLYTLYLHCETPPDEMHDTIRSALSRLSKDERAPPDVMLRYAQDLAETKGKTMPHWAVTSRSGCQLWIMANE